VQGIYGTVNFRCLSVYLLEYASAVFFPILNEVYNGLVRSNTVLTGDPLCDIIPLHLDVFRGDNDLLREFLQSYQIPFLRGESNTDMYKCLQNSKFSRASYRAM
jgi:hypothetical protein